MSRPVHAPTDTAGHPGTAVGDHGVMGLLEALIAHCADTLAADAAVILLGDTHDQLRVAAASSNVITVEPLVLSGDDNPYVQCYRTAAQVRIPDISQVRSRWPEFVVAVERAGTFRSVHVLPMRLHGTTIGALSVFHDAPGPLPHTDLALGQALADVAAIGIESERTLRRGEIITDQLHTTLTSRIVIEQAKGIVSYCTGLTMDEAFVLLRDHSHHRRQRLSDLAQQIVARTLDPTTLAPTEPHPGRHRQHD